VIDRKLEPLIKRLMVKYLGEMEEDDLIMFVLEHLKDHKGPHKLVDGLEPVRLLTNIVVTFTLLLIYSGP
jgi:transposase